MFPTCYEKEYIQGKDFPKSFHESLTNHCEKQHNFTIHWKAALPYNLNWAYPCFNQWNNSAERGRGSIPLISYAEGELQAVYLTSLFRSLVSSRYFVLQIPSSPLTTSHGCWGWRGVGCLKHQIGKASLHHPCITIKRYRHPDFSCRSWKIYRDDTAAHLQQSDSIQQVSVHRARSTTNSSPHKPTLRKTKSGSNPYSCSLVCHVSVFSQPVNGQKYLFAKHILHTGIMRRNWGLLWERMGAPIYIKSPGGKPRRKERKTAPGLACSCAFNSRLLQRNQQAKLSSRIITWQ